MKRARPRSHADQQRAPARTRQRPGGDDVTCHLPLFLPFSSPGSRRKWSGPGSAASPGPPASSPRRVGASHNPCRCGLGGVGEAAVALEHAVLAPLRRGGGVAAVGTAAGLNSGRRLAQVSLRGVHCSWHAAHACCRPAGRTLVSLRRLCRHRAAAPRSPRPATPEASPGAPGGAGQPGLRTVFPWRCGDVYAWRRRDVSASMDSLVTSIETGRPLLLPVHRQ